MLGFANRGPANKRVQGCEADNEKATVTPARNLRPDLSERNDVVALSRSAGFGEPADFGNRRYRPRGSTPSRCRTKKSMRRRLP